MSTDMTQEHYEQRGLWMVEWCCGVSSSLEGRMIKISLGILSSDNRYMWGPDIITHTLTHTFSISVKCTTKQYTCSQEYLKLKVLHSVGPCLATDVQSTA